jgi:CRISPR-associated protein Cmr1
MSNHVKQITARFRVTTPLFAGGATPARAELRATSFKGLLRFWWRALPEQARLDSTALARAEAALFGSARLRQSRVRLRLEVLREPMPLTPPTRLNRNGSGAGNDKDLIGPGARYLGYGLIQAFDSKDKETRQVIKAAGELQRPCLPAPFDLSLHVHLLPGVRDEQAEQVESALILMGTLGGLGSRARRGFGSLSLVELTREGEAVWPPEGKRFEHAFPDWFRTRYEKSAAKLPEWTAISRQTRLLLLRKESPESAVSLMDRIGKEMVRYRSWGTSRMGLIDGRGKVLESERSEQNFEPDHELYYLMKKRRQEPETHPARIAFGLPHNYGKEDHVKVGPAERELDRRASPLFLHIHQTDAQTPPIAVVSFLPARFLPGTKPRISVGDTDVEMLPESDLYEPVRRFLMRLAGEERDDLRGTKPRDRFEVIGKIGMSGGGQP